MTIILLTFAWIFAGAVSLMLGSILIDHLWDSFKKDFDGNLAMLILLIGFLSGIYLLFHYFL